jgi:hypothetical protein
MKKILRLLTVDCLLLTATAAPSHALQIAPANPGGGAQTAAQTAAGTGGAAPAAAPLQIKKAGAVVEQQQEKMDAAVGTNLVGMAIGLWSGIQALKKEEQALNAACAPTGAEESYVNKMVKEFAKIGTTTAESMAALVDAPESYEGSCRYESYIMTGGNGNRCFDTFNDPVSDGGRIWGKYPKASSVRNICPPTKKGTCGNNDKKTYSNAYEIYARMGWEEEDLLPDEVSMHAKIMQKAQECDPSVLKKKSKEAVGNMITGTLGTIGQKQNTAGTMEQVSGLMQNMNAGGGTFQTLGTAGIGLLPTLMGGK